MVYHLQHREGRLCEHFDGYTTINQIPLPLQHPETEDPYFKQLHVLTKMGGLASEWVKPFRNAAMI